MTSTRYEIILDAGVTRVVCSVTLVMLCCVPGCGRSSSNHRPLTDNDLQLMAVSAMHWPQLEDLRIGRTISITPEHARMVVEAFRPVVAAAKDVPATFQADFELRYQAGMDPVSFHIQLGDEDLVFSERGFFYQGGDIQRFKALITEAFGSQPDHG